MRKGEKLGEREMWATTQVRQPYSVVAVYLWEITHAAYLSCPYDWPQAVDALASRDFRLQVFGGVLVPVREDGGVAEEQENDGNNKGPRS